MVSPDTALRRLLRDTAKLLQPYGFHGNEPIWTRVEDAGVASVGRTRVSRTWTDGQQTLAFGLTASATPAAWWEYCRRRDEARGRTPVPLAAATGPDLLGPHPKPGEPPAPWTLRVDPGQPGGHALQSDIESIRAELPRRVHAYARRAVQLLEPGRYLEELLALPDPGVRTWEAIVVLLADDGPGPRLEDAIERYRECAIGHGEADRVAEVVDYARGHGFRAADLVG
ncbi:hypothetical protein [Nocardia shimofusensis]|uniref:hypothetical protein n=1 Tax=Nocardia shimofusensis TaxID=228596 RepID=UPI00083566A1|nr:hypothetical protein [Nocardia shimofusensis]